MSFVFYDTETTGTNTVFDQILQFAAVRTDEDLKELEQLNVRCRLLPHVVPSPGAMRVTGLAASQLVDSSLPTHYAMVRAIRDRLLSWRPALYLGYNSLHFDEHLLRQALYQTLHPPYLTNTDGNCRADVLRLVRMADLFAPGVLSVPCDDETGKPTFRLERVAPANGWDHVDAHDALADARAAIHLCRLVAGRAPQIWSNFLQFTQKSAVIDYVRDELVFSLSDFHFSEPHSWLVTSLGVSPSRSSEVLVFDLSINPDEVRPLLDDELDARLSRLPRVVRRLRSNACPIIMPAEDAPDIAAGKLEGIGELERRAANVREDVDLRERLVAAFERSRKQYDPWPHVEQQIHDSFISDGDRRRLEAFHEAPWEIRLSLLDDIEDRRLRQLGRRLIFLERPDVLPADLQRDMTIMVAKRITGSGDPAAWLRLDEAIRDADEMIAASNGGQAAALLKEHRDFLAKRLLEMAMHIS
jgi:exodeoxyribonuclease-1